MYVVERIILTNDGKARQEQGKLYTDDNVAHIQLTVPEGTTVIVPESAFVEFNGEAWTVRVR